MAKRYSKTEIDKAINDIYCGDRAIGVIRQLLADKDKLVDLVLRLHNCIDVIPNSLAVSAMKDSIEIALKEAGE